VLGDSSFDLNSAVTYLASPLSMMHDLSLLRRKIRVKLFSDFHFSRLDKILSFLLKQLQIEDRRNT
jgi:hypothetical protein